MSLSRFKTAAAAVLVTLGLASQAMAADPAKIGFVYIGPTGDHGWTYAHDQGRKAVEAKFGDKASCAKCHKQTVCANCHTKDEMASGK